MFKQNEYELNDGLLTMWTSPIIVNANGDKYIIVHAHFGNDNKSMYCGMRLPDFTLEYNSGFDKIHFKTVLELIIDNNELFSRQAKEQGVIQDNYK